MTDIDAAARDRLLRWRSDPVLFVQECFGVEPDAWQRDALVAFADPAIPRISMQACAGPGKSALLAWCGWHFMACQGDEHDHPNGLCTSITGENLAANLWKEFAKWQSRSPFLQAAFVWTAERIFSRTHKATWFLGARTWPKTASPEEQGKTLSGLHGDYVLVMIDESGAIPPAVQRAADQSLSTKPKFAKILQAGNPISRDGMLYEASVSGQWHVVRITGDPDDPRRSPRIDIEWARDQIKRHGREDPWVMAYILGQFPRGSISALLTPDEVRDSMERIAKRMDFDHAPRILGVDVAREGDDLSVIFRRQGICACWEPRRGRGIRSYDGAGLVSQEARDFAVDAIFIDNTGGFGGGWVDALHQLGVPGVTPVHFASEPSDRRYLNRRAEMWFRMAEWVKAGGCLPNVPELVAELTTPTYSFRGDRLLLEPKEVVKKRLGRSPDYADALALTFAANVTRRDDSPALLHPMQTKHGRSDDERMRGSWDVLKGF